LSNDFNQRQTDRRKTRVDRVAAGLTALRDRIAFGSASRNRWGLLNRAPRGKIVPFQIGRASMTSISHNAAAAEVRAAPKAKARNAALDRSRTFITMLVLIHHSVIAYT
jgi:hypothetical protein